MAIPERHGREHLVAVCTGHRGLLVISCVVVVPTRVVLELQLADFAKEIRFWTHLSAFFLSVLRSFGDK
jgi:hypothetical protein